MRDDLVTVLEFYTAKNRRRRGWRKFVQIMGCFVVFCTTYALILPAITQESDIYCGIEEHVHTDACYEASAETLWLLDCPVTGDVAHTHNGDCLDGKGELVCTLPEREQHIHTGDCYSNGNSTDETADPSEPELICTDPLAVVHVHSEDCFRSSEPVSLLICGREEHSHTLICHSDAQADLETEEIWTQSFAAAELTGNWKQDLLAIAQTQLGYGESTRNYEVCDDGISVRGYTRYGAWYGDPYGDWDAMFVSFCLHHAGVQMPLESDAARWIQTLSEERWALYHGRGDYVPQPGELIFFDGDGDGNADHTGIVTNVSAEEGGVPRITTLEGDVVGRVEAQEYDLDDTAILGYASLPVQLTAEEQQAVDMVIARIEALPSAAEIETQIAGYQADGDAAGEEAYFKQVSQQVAEAYYYYSQLEEYQKKTVTNADKLLELEEIWQVTEYTGNNEIVSDPVTVIPSADTGDLVKLNIYDYYGLYSAAVAGKTDINDWFRNVSQEFPGFHWSAGAYPYRYSIGEEDWIADRQLPECLDFGNSLITDYTISDPLYEPDGAAAWENGCRGEQPGSAVLAAGETGINNVLSGGSRPIGVTEGSAVVSGKLDENGYPSLVYSGEGIEDYDPSLGYLFDENHPGKFADRKNTENIDGLFRRDPVSGEYFYNSRWNHAQFSTSTSSFTLYDQTLTPNFILYPFGNFLPFQDITVKQENTQLLAFNYQGGVRDYLLTILDDLEIRNTAAQGGDLSVTQLIRMLESYCRSWEASGQWNALTAADALNDFRNGAANPDWTTQPELMALLAELYNIDYDVRKNFFFGMDMEMTFLQAENGLTGADNGNNSSGTWEWAVDKNGDTLTEADDTQILTGGKDGIPDYPMVFSFTGDDDVWVYIDGIRFLDLSGIHDHVGGTIDFEKGMVYYYQRDPKALSGTRKDAYAQQSFWEILTQYGGVAEEELGKYLKQDADGSYTTFHDYSVHTLRFYYLERGAGSSLCDIRFNLPLIRENTLAVSRENTCDGNVLGDPDYYFNILSSSNELFVGPGSVTGITQYKVLDSQGNVLKNQDGTDKLFTTDAYGIFTLKAGQTALFEGIEQNHGLFFIQELIPAEDVGQYSRATFNNSPAEDAGLIDWSERPYFSGESAYEGPYECQWYGRNSRTGDTASADTFVFTYRTGVDGTKFGSLSITQELIGAETDRTFAVEVLLDGAKLPAGTVYTVDGEERTVPEDGLISLRPGETATIESILSGTRFVVREVDGAPYTVSYGYSGSTMAEYSLFAQNDNMTGVIRTGSDAAITVTNAEDGASVQIPVTVSLANGDGQTHTYTFLLEQVTDSTGHTLVENGTVLEQNVTVADEPVLFQFGLAYLKTQLETMPATFYYRITEKGEEADCLDNTQQFVAQVLVEETDSGIRATLMSINGASDLLTADFANTLAGSLTIHTTVNGDDEHKAKTVDLEIQLTPQTDMTLPAEIQAVRTNANGVQTMLTLCPVDGLIRIEGLGDGEALRLTGIPVGTQWRIEQAYVNGLITTNRVGDVKGESRFTFGNIAAGDTAVTYINTQTYVLPETGGTGTFQYTMAGWMLMLCSAAYLLYKYTLRRRGDVGNP